MRTKALLWLLLSGLAGCTSLWTQRDHQAVAWSDGDEARIDVWLRQGSSDVGVPWLTLADVVATPVIWVAEVQFGVFAALSDDARIEWGPLGFLASLLPCITCVPLDNKPYAWLHLSSALHLGPEDRAELAGLGEGAGVEWLAARYVAQFPEDAGAADRVRKWVSGVSLAEPARK
ncbi:MAG: hypothetical protein H6838_07230 [Planctomycetes bacterium]|nr:hypothetical protein [Planctomycetota bacterium]